MGPAPLPAPPRGWAGDCTGLTRHLADTSGVQTVISDLAKQKLAS